MFLSHCTRFYSCHVYHRLLSHGLLLHLKLCRSIYILRGDKVCKNRYVTVADRLIPIHEAALCFRIRLFYISLAHQLLCTCFRLALVVRFHIFEVVGGCLASSQLLLCTALIFYFWSPNGCDVYSRCHSDRSCTPMENKYLARIP